MDSAPRVSVTALVACLVLLLSSGGTTAPTGYVTAAAEPPDDSGVLRAGDYAVYTFGSCSQPHIPLYPPFFGFEDAEDPEEQVRGLAWACPVTLRWEVLSAGQGMAEVLIGMEGWFWRIDEVGNPIGIGMGPGLEDPDAVRDEINATLHSTQTVHVDLTTMDASATNGRYLGRWSFHMPLEDVLASRTEVLRNWYHGTVLPANVSVGSELPLGTHHPMKAYYGADTFIQARIGQDVPIPEGLDRYLLYQPGGGWHTLKAMRQVYDANTSLLLTSIGTLPDDLLFNLYGIIWIADLYLGPARPFLSSLALVDTNILDVLLEVPVGDGPPSDDGGGADDGTGDTGTEDGTPEDGAGGGTEPGTGDAEPPPSLTVPWRPLALAAVFLLIAAIIYRDLRGARSGPAGRVRGRPAQRPPPPPEDR